MTRQLTDGASTPQVVIPQKRGMRVLFVVPEFPPDVGGGIIAFYGALVPALQKRGHDVHVVVGSASVTDGRRYAWGGIPVSGLEHARFERLLPQFARYRAVPAVQQSLAAAWALYEQVDGGQNFDVVHVVDWGMLFAPWVTHSGPPCVVDLHGSSGQIGRHEPVDGAELQAASFHLLERCLLARANLLRAHSRLNQSYWEERTGREVRYGPPPLLVESASRANRSSDHGFVAARLQHWKGPDTLCEALVSLGAHAPTIEWAGRAVIHHRARVPYDEYLARAYPEVWGEKLRWLGQLDPTETARRQAEAAFVIVPSTWDVFNLTAVESMARSGVVICSDGAGAADLIVDGQNGFIFRREDARGLAEAITRVVKLTPAEKVRIGDQARETTKVTLDPDVVAKQVEDQHREVMGGADRAAGDELSDLVSPDASGRPYAFLDHLPLRDLSTYSARRLISKVASSPRGVMGILERKNF